MFIWKELGKYYGYPECCTAWFITRGLRIMNSEGNTPFTSQQDLVSDGKGFIPCPSCADKITRDNIDSLIKDRICSTPYPNDGSDEELDHYLLKLSIEKNK